MSFRRARWTLGLLGLALSGSAGATVMVPMSLEDLTGDAEVVVRGRVVAIESAWDRAHQRIYTTARLVVTDSVLEKVSVDREVLVRSLGGEVGEIGMKVAGSPQFSMGEDVLLFLRRDAGEPGSFAVVGMNQGRFAVKSDAAGRLIAAASLEGIALARPGADGVLRVAGRDVDPAAIPYDALKTRVRALAAPSPAAPAVTAPTLAPGTKPAAGAAPSR